MTRYAPKITFRTAALWPAALWLAACASGPDNALPSAAPARPSGYITLDEARPTLAQSSAECLAQNLKPGDPFPASAIPEPALKNRQSGWVAMRYDVVAGAAQNITVVDSRPAGVYDAAALQHAARYRDPTRSTVRGCIMTIEVKF
jgi:hypothetical protein